MSDILEDPTLVKLVNLRDAIRNLYSLSMPEQARAALQDINRQVELLVRLFASSSGQSRLAALYKVNQVLGTSLDLDQVLNQVMDAVIELTGAERGFLMLLDGEQGALSLRAARSTDHASLERKAMEVSQSIIREVLEQGVGVLSTDAQQDPRFAGKDSIIFFALRSVMCAPLRARGKIIGVIYVDNRAQIGIFTDNDLEMLNAFAIQAAIAIENARLYTRTDQALAARVAELETLSKIDKQLNERLDFELAASITCRWAIDGTDAIRGWLMRYEEDASLTFIAGSDSELGDNLRKCIDTTMQECVISEFSPTSSSNAYLVAPIHCSSKPRFVIAVERKEPFAEQSVQFLARLAGRAGTALENAYLYKAVQDANTAKTKFVSIVTHELRIPMTSIKGYTDLLRQGAAGVVSEQQLEFLDVIRNNVDRMSTLVSDLSDISHIETGRIDLSPRFISIADVVQDTLISLEPRIKKKAQELVVNLPPDLPRAYADPNRLVQIMTNLLNNAHKYTPENGRLSLSVMLAGEFIRIEVQDNGIGISLEDQHYIFSQFFRADNPTVRDQQGWGLGLNLAHRLVYLMGGEMGVQSALGQGSTFWFTIPTRQE